MTFDIFKPFDIYESLAVYSVFLNISKVIDKVWHDRLISKLTNHGILCDQKVNEEKF